MKIAVGCDHAGYPLKKSVVEAICQAGHKVIDLGTHGTNPVDYPDYALKVGLAVVSHGAERGIMICGSGVGASIALNKIESIYAALCHDVYSAHQSVEHDNANVLCMGARVIEPDLASEIVMAFLGAHFLGNESGAQRHLRRFNKVRKFESGWL